MRRVGALFALAILAALFLAGCEEETVGVVETGIEVHCVNCFAFKVDVFIDGEVIGSLSTEEPRFFEVSSGPHSLYAAGNAINHSTNEGWCWTLDFSVSDGSITRIILECSEDSQCSDSTSE
jgi:hypothetical protein